MRDWSYQTVLSLSRGCPVRVSLSDLPYLLLLLRRIGPLLLQSCMRCGGLGHVLCEARERGGAKPSRVAREMRRATHEVYCAACGGVGHTCSNCPARGASGAGGGGASRKRARDDGAGGDARAAAHVGAPRTVRPPHERDEMARRAAAAAEGRHLWIHPRREREEADASARADALLAEAAAHFNGGASARPHRGAPDERPRHTRFEEDGDAAGEPPRKRKKKAIEGRRLQPKPRGGAR